MYTTRREAAPRGRERFTQSTCDGKATVHGRRHQTRTVRFPKPYRTFERSGPRGTYESAFLGGRHHVRNVRTAPLFEEFRTLMTSTFKYPAHMSCRYSTRLTTKARHEVELPTCKRRFRMTSWAAFEGSERKKPEGASIQLVAGECLSVLSNVH